MSALIKFQEKAVEAWYEKNPWAAIRGIDEPMWNALCSSIYPGSQPDSILMAVDYCKARGLDIMLKPVHLVPMDIKQADGTKKKRDVPMPGVGLYRIQADRSGTYAGADEPEFGPIIEQSFQGQSYDKESITVTVRYPEWCKYTVYKTIGDRIVKFTAQEFWLENYAQQGWNEAPNAMWKKRPFGQLAKCAEAQALRKGWPEIGQEPTAEEMAGKPYIVEHDVTPSDEPKAEVLSLSYYPAADFDANFNKWAKLIADGKKTADDIITTVSTKGQLTEQQIEQIKSVQVGENA